MTPDIQLRDRVTQERLLAAHPAYDAVELTVSSPDGNDRTKPAIRHRGAVCILPILHEKGQPPRLVLIENDRIIPGIRLLEVAAGGIDNEESPREAAERELHEETGYTASALTSLGSFYTSPGMSDEVMHAFLATDLTEVGQALDPWESITVRRFSLAEINELLDTNQIRDGKTIATLLLAKRRGFLDP